MNLAQCIIIANVAIIALSAIGILSIGTAWEITPTWKLAATVWFIVFVLMASIRNSL